MLYRFAFALGLLCLGVYLGRELSRSYPAAGAARKAHRPLPRHLMHAPMDNVSVH